MAGLHFDITGDNTNLLRKLQETENGVKSVSRTVEKEGGNIEDLFNRLARSAAAIGVGFSAKEFISKAAQIRGEFQKLEVAFTTMLGSKEQAEKLMEQMIRTAATTPFSLQDVAGGAKQLLAYGIEAERVNETLIRLGDIAAGLSIPLGDLVYLYGTTRAQGRLYTEDFNQFTSRGIPMIEMLADKFGVAENEVKGLVEAGKVGFPEVQEVIEKLTNEGGKFGGLMEAQSKTIAGQISNIEDSIETMFNEIGKANEGVINEALSGVSSLIENYEKVGTVIASLVAVYGTYKVAVMTVTALQSLQATGIAALTTKEVIHYGWLVATQKAQMLLNATMLANPYVAVAAAVAGVAAAIWNFHDSSTEAEKAQKRLNERQQEAQKEAEDHKRKIDALIESSRDIALSDLQRGQSLAELRKEYPKIFAQYDIETIKLADILKLKQKISEEDARQAGEKQKQDFANIESEIAYYENLLKSLSGQQGVDGYVKKLKELRAERDILLQDKGKGISEQFISSLKDIDINEFDRYISELEKRIKGKGENGKIKMRLPIDVKGSLSDEALFEVKDIKTLIDTAKSTKQSRIDAKENQTNYQKDYDAAKKAWEEAKKKLEEIENDKKAFTSKQYEDAKTDYDDKKKKYESLGGITSDKAINDAKKRAEEEKKEQEQLAEALLQLRFQNQQDEINLMQEGSEKKRKQIELDYQKEIDAYNKAKAKYGETDEVKQMKTLADEKRKEGLSGLVEEEQQKLQSMLEKYQDYAAQREAIEKQLNEDITYLETQRTEENSANIDRAIKVAKEKAAKAVKEITDEESKALVNDSGIFARLFSDSSSMTKASLKKVIAEAKTLVEYLSGISIEKPLGFTEDQLEALKGDAESIKEIYDALIEKQDELDKRTDYPFDGIVKGFRKIKESSELAKRAIEETNEEKKKLLQSQSEAEYGKGVSYLKDGALEASDAVGFLAEQVSILAEATGDAKFKEFSDQFSAFSQNLQAAGQGAQSGGWIGAIVGGASNMITQTVASMAQLQSEAYEYEQNRIDFLREIEKISLSLKDEDYDSIFGTSSIEKARDAYELAQEALEKYNEELQRTSDFEIEEEYKNLGAAIFAPIFGSFGFGKKISEETKALMEAYEKGYTDLQAMAVKTKDRSGWANFWGKKDEYTALKDLAPELWNDDGTFNVEAAEAFLETNTQISDEQRKQIQNVIDLKNAYDENISIIDEMLASTFGSLGSDITDIIFDSVRNGTDAWEQFREVGSGVIDELGKQMIQELYVQTYLETFKERMRAAYGLDSVEDTQKELANIMADIYNGLGAVFAGASDAAEEWDKWAASQGFTPGESSGSGDVSSSIEGLDELQKAYEKLSKQVSKAYSNESVRILQQQNENLREQARLIQERIDAGMSSDELKEQLEDINTQIEDNKEAMKDAIFGEDIQSAIANFVSAYTEALGNGGSIQEMSKDFVESMVQNMVTESMKADASPVIENIREKLIEAWKDGVVTADEQLSIEQIVNNLNKELSDKYSWAEELFKESDIEGLEALQDAYDRLSDSVSEAYSSNKAELLRQQNEILQQQRDLILERLEAEKALGERGDSSLVNEWEEQLEEVNNQIEENKKAQLDAIFGQNTQTQISNLANALINVWSGAEKKADSAKDFINGIIKSMVLEALSMDLTPFIDSLREQMAEMFKDGIISAEEGDALAGMVEGVMDSLEKQYAWADRFIKEEEEVVEEIAETFSNITFESMRDDFTSQLSDMATSYEDMCNNFEEKLKESIIRGFIQSKYQSQIQNLISTWDMYGDSENIDSDEMKKLREQYKELISAMIKDRDKLAEQFGWSKFQQEATSKGFETMSQDTGEELNGRFTALYEVGLQILQNISSLQSISVSAQSSDATLLEIKNLMILSNGHLEDISTFAKKILDGFGKKLDDINANLKNAL
ncbi:tape measure protein [Caecibacteroides pullorum]|uniref:Tape measure protein n=1 Tax=Caecibacteroides pullorum TaxID=2725562 RepID=A0AA40ZRW4_9BACT|nr:tape measure protein [Caecibacteroides pullorum]MBM6856497.1 tape measure protein [Caecibacteroides pullorum]MBV8057503.1 tape measure protein [Caecibacteroides pullorum]